MELQIQRSAPLCGECLSHMCVIPDPRLNSAKELSSLGRKTPLLPCLHTALAPRDCICCGDHLTIKSTWESGCVCFYEEEQRANQQSREGKADDKLVSWPCLLSCTSPRGLQHPGSQPLQPSFHSRRDVKQITYTFPC